MKCLQYSLPLLVSALVSGGCGVSAQDRFYPYSNSIVGGRSVYSARSNGGVVLDDLQRGQEGLVVQLEHLNKALKEDELKLNNVFYKLGRHDTDIETTNDLQITIKRSTQKLEAKLNKQSYNVDFLRRHVSELKRGVSKSTATSASVAALQKTIDTLQMTLAQALYRTSQLENKTKDLEHKQQLSSHSDSFEDNNIYYSSKAPKTTYYYMEGDSLAGICDELKGWTVTGNGGCLWIGEKMLNYTQSIAECASKGAFLATIHSNDEDWQQPYLKQFEANPRHHYWTSASSVFTGSWSYMFSGSPVNDVHWADAILSSSQTGNRKCGALTSSGLVAFTCAMRNYFICEKF